MSKLRFLKAVMVIALLSVFVLSAGAQEDNFIHVSNGTSDIPYLDPSLATDVQSIQYINELFPGLTISDEVTAETKPAMATWDLSDDGLVYTFHIVNDVPWVKYNTSTGEVEQVMVDGSPRYVVAQDFINGMTRSMDPRTGSYYGSILAGWVVGGLDLFRSIDDAADDASEEDLAAMVDAAIPGLGLVAVDDYTLEATVTQPAGFAATLLGMWMSTAQPSWLVAEYGDAWTEPENVVSYGPFTLSEWVHGESATIVKNPFWPGTEGVPVAQIDGVIDTFLDASASLANYEAGLLDASGVPLPEFARVQADPVLSQELHLGSGQCTFYVAFNLTKAPTDDIRVRQALSQGLDRQLIIDSIYSGIGEPAYFFSRPELAAAPNLETNGDVALLEDATAAKAKIDEYVAEKGEMPVIQFLTTASETSALIAAAMQEMWSDSLGVEVEIQQQEWAVFLETTDTPETAPNMWTLGWCQDYPDTHNFLFDVFHSSTIDNGTGFLNEEFDGLLEEARGLTDNSERQALYARAEEILTNEVLAIAPYRYNGSVRLVKPYVDRPYGASVTQFELWSINR